MYWDQTTEMHGTFEGMCHTNFIMTINFTNPVAYPFGSFVSEGDTVFTGQVNGLPGESIHHFRVNGYFTAPFSPTNVALVFQGPATITSGKGALSHLAGTYVMDVGINQTGHTPPYWFNYTGTLWYDPHIEKD